MTGPEWVAAGVAVVLAYSFGRKDGRTFAQDTPEAKRVREQLLERERLLGEWNRIKGQELDRDGRLLRAVATFLDEDAKPGFGADGLKDALLELSAAYYAFPLMAREAARLNQAVRFTTQPDERVRPAYGLDHALADMGAAWCDCNGSPSHARGVGTCTAGKS